ncbi:unnamed protein product [Rotaria sp. Silwood1]|nr:unnamed protein product [Rotaria sp. Silwood1]
MSQSNVDFLDLPNEILLHILKKLDNICVLYSLFGVINERFDSLLQDNIFTNTLNLLTNTADDKSSLIDPILNRFCIDILPRIHYNVKHLILESMSMKRILLIGTFPNLTHLKVFNFGRHIALNYFTDRSIFQHIFKHQITELILENSDQDSWIILSQQYTENVYARILTFFENLTHLSIVKSSSISGYPPLSIRGLPSTIFFSSILTKLDINVESINDCFHLLDGRLKQLTTFIVQIESIDNNSRTVHNTNELPNLKCFSLTSYYETNAYGRQVIPLLRCMTHLEKLTLYIRIYNRSTFVDGTNLHKDILIHMPRLHTFTFYISTDIQFDDSVHYLSDNDIQQTFTNIGYHQIACSVNYFYRKYRAFPNIIFNTVTYLLVGDLIPFKYDFFIQIAKAFPSLKDFCIINVTSPLWNFDSYTADRIDSHSYIEYPNLTSLNVKYVDNYYIEQFLLDTKTYAPHLTEIKVYFNKLKTVTENFTRDATRYNCRNIKQLIFEKTMNYPKELYLYFPSLVV